LKVFVTTYSATYQLYDNVLEEVSGSVIPAAITYTKDSDGNYSMSDYVHAEDGSNFAPSIREFCTRPVTDEEIKGLADKMLKHYNDYEDIRNLQQENLEKHLINNNITVETVINNKGEQYFNHWLLFVFTKYGNIINNSVDV